MKAKHHFWSSLLVGAGLYAATGEVSAWTGAMLGGFFIDGDHLFDQLWAVCHHAPLRRAAPSQTEAATTGLSAFVRAYLQPRKLLRLPLIFHSYELLAAVLAITLFFRSSFWIGLLVGYALHLALDLYRHHHEFHSPLFYLLSYRLAHGFRRERLIRAEYV